MMAIDGRAIESQAEMLARLAEAGDSIRLEVDRKGRAFSLEARRNKPTANVQEPQ